MQAKAEPMSLTFPVAKKLKDGSPVQLRRNKRVGPLYFSRRTRVRGPDPLFYADVF
jgi:hypothetical protein